MPLGQIQARLFQVTFSGKPWWKNLDGLMPAYMEGREGNFPIRTYKQSLRMSGPVGGALSVPAAGHPLCRFVPHSVCSRWR
jgi:hypothetical protein